MRGKTTLSEEETAQAIIAGIARGTGLRPDQLKIGRSAHCNYRSQDNG
jgi:hypothetical protein